MIKVITYDQWTQNYNVQKRSTNDAIPIYLIMFSVSKSTNQI